MDVQIFLSDLISRLDIPSSLRTYNRQNRLCCLFQDKYLFFCKVLYRVTSLCKSVHFVFYFYTRSLFLSKIVVPYHFFYNLCIQIIFVMSEIFWFAYLWITAIHFVLSYLLQIIIVNHFFFCKLRSLRTECQESPFRERQDCSKRVPFEAKPV